MPTKLLLLAIFMAVSPMLYAQNVKEYKKEQYVMAQDTLPYRILFPKNFDKEKKYPLVLFLHGSGERGQDNELQLTHGADLFLDKEVREKYPEIGRAHV